MDTIAVVLEAPERLSLQRLALNPAAEDDVVVQVDWSGISTGTERLLYSGRMPPFPGMGYPLVPGYESVGRIIDAGPANAARIGERVFVPGANCYTNARGLFGGAARRLIVPSRRAHVVAEGLQDRAVLIALAATAYHAVAPGVLPDLIIGHGVLGRLLARVAMAMGGAAPTVWETNPARATGATCYPVIHPDADDRRDYRSIYDVSGDAGLLDTLIARLARGGEIVLAGFYEAQLAFTFPAAFMREAKLRIAAEWQPDDLSATTALIASGALSLDGLITHRAAANDAEAAYPTAFGDAACLKMVLDWSACA
jgi:3-hydroxyethyl bacteriochlorophyllide a dehydrogenase